METKQILKMSAATVLYIALVPVIFAQNPDPSKWMCRNLDDSGGFVYQGETIFGSQACRPVPQVSAQTHEPASPGSVAFATVQPPETRVQPIPAANNASSLQTPSRKSQTTTFMHQTLGESWEDFMRITGSKINPCASDKSAQLCDSYKQIEAVGNGTLTQSTPSASASLTFSQKKLVQVLVVAKADWGKSLAEFTQTYGTPDMQTNNSAVWTFADGGEIAVNRDSVNLVRANFYSKDGKPDQMTPVDPELSQAQSFVGSESTTPALLPSSGLQSENLTLAEIQAAAQGSGKGVTITAGSEIGQSFAAGLANVNLAQFASIQLYTTESWIGFHARLAHRQYQQFDPAALSPTETLRGLTVVALGGAYGSLAGPQCNSVTRIALISDKGGAVVAEAVSQDTASSSWSNAFGASASCNALMAKFAFTDVQRVASAAQKGEYFVGVFSGTNLLFMYKVKEKYLRELGR
jgi:hypothetical protein